MLKTSLQKKKIHFAQKVLKKGINAATYILFSLKDGKKLFLEMLPNSYPQFKFMKRILGADFKKPTLKKETIRANLYRLKKQGLITEDPQEKTYYLTSQGKEILEYLQDRYWISKKRWDRKLRIVIFDIPEKRKKWRDYLREQLLFLQFHQLQKSVYIGKYPLPEGVYKEINEAGLDQYIFILTIREINKKEKIFRILEEK